MVLMERLGVGRGENYWAGKGPRGVWVLGVICSLCGPGEVVVDKVVEGEWYIGYSD